MNFKTPDLSIVLPTLNEGKNISSLIQKLNETVGRLGITCEILVVDGGSRDGTVEKARQAGAQIVQQEQPGYGAALRAGFASAQCPYILTMDADFSHDPQYIPHLWNEREKADLIIASRYVPHGQADMTLDRRLLSRFVNIFFARLLDLPVKDLSSGFRLYRKSLLESFSFAANGYDVQIEVVLKTVGQGWRIMEVPFHYHARLFGKSHVRFFQFGWIYTLAFLRLWRLRHSVYCADYDLRAFDSIILPQRWWQRRRHAILASLCGNPTLLLDAGCGTGKFFFSRPQAVGIDLSLAKLRYLRSTHRKLAQASVERLPFRDGVFDCLVCSEVIEHVPGDPLREFWRVLKPGGSLILSTPDYGRLRWRMIEAIYDRLLPGGYACEHVTHYTASHVLRKLEEMGFSVESSRYLFGSVLIVVAKKPLH